MIGSENSSNQAELLRKIQAMEQRLAELEKNLAAQSNRPAAVPPPLPQTPKSAPEVIETPKPQPVATPPPIPPRQTAITELTATATVAEITPAVETAPAGSIEQKIGQTWMLIAGLGVMLLGGSFFFKYAYDQGWIDPVRRCIMGVVWAIILLCIGEYTLRKGKRFFAAGLFGAGIVWLYYTGWVTSPNGWYYPQYKMLTSNQAFAAMCAITALGIFLAVRTNIIFGAIVALVGAMATPVLLSTGENRQVELMSYLLVVDVGFLILSLWKRWSALGLIGLCGTVILFAGWAERFACISPRNVTVAFGWAYLAIFCLYVLIGQKLDIDRFTNAISGAMFGIAAGAMAVLLVRVGLSTEMAMLNLLILAGASLLFGRALRWSVIALPVFMGTAVALSWLWAMQAPADWRDPVIQQLWAKWMWYFFAVFTVDIFSRAFRRDKEVAAPDIVAALATAGLFASTYFLLHAQYPDLMGAYTVGLAAMCGLAAVLLHWRANRPDLKQTYFVLSLALLILAVPIQFDNLATTIAWGVMGLVMMLLAKYFRNLALLLVPPVTMALATLHYFAWELPSDPVMRNIAFTIEGVDISVGLLVAAGLAVAMWTMVIMLQVGRGIRGKILDEVLAQSLGGAGLVVFFVCAVAELPTISTTWCWIGATMCVLLVGLILRKPWMILFVQILLVFIIIKWVCLDTLTLLMTAPTLVLVLNGRCMSGLTVAALVASLPTLGKFRGLRVEGINAIGTAIAAFVVFWAGNIEVIRFVCNNNDWLADPNKAMHMGLSLWWGVWATTMLIAGFVFRQAGARYFAITLFGITIVKIFIFDMCGLDAAYRILSFLGLGVLLVAGSWLYHRYFRQTETLPPVPSPPEQERQEET